MNRAARRLRAYMSSLCRRAYGEGWLDHLEFALWHAVVSGPMRYGQLQIDAATIAELRVLSDECGGWINVVAPGEERCVPLPEWQDLYANNVDLVSMENPLPPPAPFGSPS